MSRIVLAPLTVEIIDHRLATDEFDLSLDAASAPIHFGRQWPGDALRLFPMWRELADADGVVPHQFVVMDSLLGHAVGAIGVKGEPDADGRIEIGYGMNEGVWGHGVATAAVAALVEILGQRDDITTITAQTATANIASQRVLAKNGFADVGKAWDDENGDLIVWERQLAASRV